MQRIKTNERRARLAKRHRLAPGSRAADAAEAAASVVCLHATDPATVFLSAWARVHPPDFAVADLERALYGERELVKQLAMRRTLWVVPRENLGIVQAAASDRVAGQERGRLVREVEKAGLYADGERWLTRAGEQVVTALADREATSTELRAELPLLEGAITYGEGKSWGGEAPVGPRVLTVLAAEGRILRGSNDGRWTASRPRWTSTTAWLGDPIAAPPARQAIAALVREWLWAFGPGTAADIKWWLGSTVAAVRTALADLEAVEVELEDGTGYLLSDDLDAVEAPGEWAALLPGLDPATMGWKERDWYVGDHGGQVFDSNGNGGPTAWWCGRIVGGWHQDAGGGVILDLLEDVGEHGRSALTTEAERLSAWLDGMQILPRFPSPLFKSARASA